MAGDSIILFGGGRMGVAMLRGWLAHGIPAAAITVVDPAPGEALQALARDHGLTINGPLTPAGTIVIAVKPQRVADLSAAVAAVAHEDSLLISIMAGKTLADLATLFPGVRACVRAMPNLPAAIGQGMTLAVAAPACTDPQRLSAERLLGSTGAFEWLGREALLDAATGLSGSGPAYLFHLADCLTVAGVAAGLPPATAERLARATIAGAGAMMAHDPTPAEQLRRDVTSPAGTTEAGLRIWMADGVLQDLATRTVRAAASRAAELSGVS